MRPTPFRWLLWRGLRGRCPICGHGPLFRRVFSLRDYCQACGYRYHRAVEYGGEGYLAGAVSLNLLLTGGVAAAALIVLAASDASVPVAFQFLFGGLWTITFPLAFHRVAIALWIAVDLRLNPPAPHELAAAPPRPAADAARRPPGTLVL